MARAPLRPIRTHKTKAVTRGTDTGSINLTHRYWKETEEEETIVYSSMKDELKIQQFHRMLNTLSDIIIRLLPFTERFTFILWQRASSNTLLCYVMSSQLLLTLTKLVLGLLAPRKLQVINN